MYSTSQLAVMDRWMTGWMGGFTNPILGNSVLIIVTVCKYCQQVTVSSLTYIKSQKVSKKREMACSQKDFL